MSAPRVSRDGFTLIEVLAVLFLTALVLGVALDFFVDLSNESAHASDSTRELRRATSLVDRIADDVERTLLVKKPKDMDPLAHPWVFLAEPSKLADNGGSDRILFIERSEPPRGDESQASDLSMVAYTLESHRDGRNGYELHRWASPQLPDRLERDFPSADDPNSLVLADDVAHFALRFLGASGDWIDRWDSSQMIDASELPVAVEIEVALMPAAAPSDTEVAQEPILYSRRVLLPMRPLDMEELTKPKAAGNGQGDDQNGLTVADCVDFTMLGPANADQANTPLTPADVQSLQDLLNNAPNLPWAPYKALFGSNPAVRANCR